MLCELIVGFISLVFFSYFGFYFLIFLFEAISSPKPKSVKQNEQ